MGERPNKKNIESLDLTQKVNILKLWHGKNVVIIMIIVKQCKCLKCFDIEFRIDDINRNNIKDNKIIIY